jgi:beta-glucosidase
VRPAPHEIANANLGQFPDDFVWGAAWKRFGLVYVDFPTLERIPKESFYWYRDLIAGQRAPA